MDLHDEAGAYSRQALLEMGEKYFLKNNSIDIQDVKNIGQKMTPKAYENLPDGPIDTNSSQGRDLILKTTIQILIFGQIPTEIFRTPTKKEQ